MLTCLGLYDFQSRQCTGCFLVFGATDNSELPAVPPTSAMGLCLNDLTDASCSNAVLCSQLDFVPGAAAQVLQFEGALGGADEHVFPLFRVVDGILKHKTYARRKITMKKREKRTLEDLTGLRHLFWIHRLLPSLSTRGQYHTALLWQRRQNLLLIGRQCFCRH